MNIFTNPIITTYTKFIVSIVQPVLASWTTGEKLFAKSMLFKKCFVLLNKSNRLTSINLHQHICTQPKQCYLSLVDSYDIW